MTTPGPGPGGAVPFTILTGFLGAGKTTTLNRMLAAPHGRRIAVLVNELGRIAIDTRLIVARGSDVLELAGGCVCCKVDLKSDLWDGIAEVVARSKPDQVVLETTGIAEPAAILDNLGRVPAAVRDRIVPAGTIAVVDAEAGAAQLDRHDEARGQVEAADRVLLRKLDRADLGQHMAVRARVAALAPTAEVASFPDSDDGAVALTAWLLAARAPRPTSGHGHRHRHGQLSAAIFADPTPLAGDAVLAVLRELGDRLVRAKGFVRLAGDVDAGFVERAGAVLELRRGLPWPGPPRTELVMIGDDLDESALRRALWACRVGT
ncbi:MAG: GTP-binding protein [Myxococcales bacterium]|nr:GTP-binding protein [Myxococcales bacterium]